MHSERAPFFLKLAAWGGVVFLHFPILIIAAYAFNTEDAAFSFPPQGLTLRWFSVAAQRSDILDAVTLSLKVAALATLIALVLGTLAAAALWRRDFFGLNLQSKCNKKRSTHQLEYNFVSTQKPLPNDEYFLPTSYNKRARKDNDFTRTGQKTSRNCQSTGT